MGHVPYPSLVLRLLLIILVALPATAHAQGLDPGQPGASSLALAGAGVASRSDPATLFQNPAAPALSRTRISVGVGLVSHSRSVHRREPGDPLTAVHDAAAARPLGHLALAQPMPVWGERISLLLGYRSGLNSGSNYPAFYEYPGKPGTSQSRIDSGRYLGTGMDLQEHLAYIGLALRWRFLHLGAALELGHLRMSLDRNLWLGAAKDRNMGKPEDLDLGASLALKTPSVAPGAVVGLLLTPLPYLSIGVSARMPVVHHLSGTAEITGSRKAPEGYSSVDASQGEGPADLELHLPLRLRGGLSAGWPLLRLSVDVAWARWSSAGKPAAELSNSHLTLKGSGKSNLNLPVPLLPLGLGLRDDISAHTGLTSELPGGFLTLRAGYAYHMGASDPDLPGATAQDLERHVMGLGVELAINPIRVGLALGHSFGVAMDTEAKDATLDNPLSPHTTANVGEGRYEAGATRVMVELQAGW